MFEWTKQEQIFMIYFYWIIPNKIKVNVITSSDASFPPFSSSLWIKQSTNAI